MKHGKVNIRIITTELGNRTQVILQKKNLNFAPHLPGYGTFNYKNDLVLTSPGQKKRSVWILPQYFHPSFGTSVRYHGNLCDKSGKPVWELHDDCCILNSVGGGQEFVIEGNDEIKK